MRSIAGQSASDVIDKHIGRVLSVRGSEASVGLVEWSWTDPEETRTTVGKFLGIRCGDRLVIGVITDASIQTSPIARERGYSVTAIVDLMGEIRDDGNETPRFSRGVTSYPSIGDPVFLITHDELKVIYDISGTDTIEIGVLQQDTSLSAYINVDEMLSKHFAILGTTGVGKSSGVAVILNEILARRPDLRIFLVDPHNEYGRCFGDRSQVLTPANLRLPFWLFSFEEIIDVVFRGRPGVDEEVEILAEIIPIARKAYNGTDRPGRKSDPRTGFSVDTPVPYRLADLIALIDDRMGKLENRSSRTVYNKLLSRIEGVCNDPRYGFMFENANVGGDTMSSVLSQLFRLPTEGRPMTIMQLAGFPVEVIDSVVSVLGRMAFDFGLWSDGRLPLLFVCEEAHRYASADRTVGFGPTRRAISRIAKEGRKYGVFLGLVTQRPAELDATIISQCSTLFAMRMSNDRDQALIRSAVSDAAANLLGFIPSLGTREVFAFGEGVAMPTRLRFKDLPADRRPRSEAVSSADTDFGKTVDPGFIDQVVDRWRSATLSTRIRPEQPGDAHAAPAPPNPVAQQVATIQQRLDPDRYRLLKKPAKI
jgi:DNA helicase HerA-like ATPase